MEAVAFIGKVLLAGVFLVAGIAKLLDREGSRDALRGFGVPAPLVPSGALALPILELAIAAMLLIPATLMYGAAGALGLLTLFVLAIGINMAQGKAPDCHCFGQLHSAPAGWSTLARNAALGGVAGLVLSQGDSAQLADVTSWARDLDVVEGALVALSVLAVVQLAFIFGLLRQNGRILLRLDEVEAGSGAAGERTEAAVTVGLRIGDAAPDFSLPGIHGETMTLTALRAKGKPVVLLFTDPSCGPCNQVMPDVGEWQRDHNDKVTVALVSRRTDKENLSKAARYGLSNVLLQEDYEVAEAFHYKGTPSAIVINADGTVGAELVAGPTQIRQLMTQVLGAETQSSAAATQSPEARPAQNGPQALPVGNPSPNFELRDLSGEMIRFSDFNKGKGTLLLFWNPSCGFCKKMLDDLKAWEASRGDDSPQLLVLSRGSVEENVAMGLKSQIVMDDFAGIAAQFGAVGTPMAVLIDRDMKVASPVASGAGAVLELAGASSLSA